MTLKEEELEAEGRVRCHQHGTVPCKVLEKRGVMIDEWQRLGRASTRWSFSC